MGKLRHRQQLQKAMTRAEKKATATHPLTAGSPKPTWQLTTLCNSSSEKLSALFGLQAHIQVTNLQHPYTFKQTKHLDFNRNGVEPRLLERKQKRRSPSSSERPQSSDPMLLSVQRATTICYARTLLATQHISTPGPCKMIEIVTSSLQMRASRPEKLSDSPKPPW